MKLTWLKAKLVPARLQITSDMNEFEFCAKWGVTPAEAKRLHESLLLFARQSPFWARNDLLSVN